eukprot:TRINITY_DN24453_c0_g1_i1.p3 TRINITY_DN24453_c0_g1~~TRINITY_DN24453_c0_g1_i1.p3  ORF type:complete len:194 (+),score=37.73 TRINITY_DN24453_c0_g1_i1:260-841(+)
MGIAATIGKATRFAGLAAMVIYAAGWVIALAGLALSQKWCKDNLAAVKGVAEASPSALLYTLVAREPGANCKDLYRLPWFLWSVSVVPVIVMVANMIAPKFVRLTSGGLFAVLAVFQIIGTDTFVNFEENAVSDSISDVRRNTRVAIVGFAFMASISLLMVVLDVLQFPQHEEHHSDETAVHGERRSDASDKV